MNGYLIILVIITIVSICAFIIINSYNKLKIYDDKMKKAEKVIIKNINKKSDILNNISKTVKKCCKKEYLKDYTDIKKLNEDNVSKDSRLSDGEKLFNDLYKDYVSLRKNKDIKKYLEELRETNELLVSSKNMFNKNLDKYNKLNKNIINKIVSRFLHNDYNYYHNIKTDDEL